MDEFDPWTAAWRWAWPTWQSHLRHAGWHPLAAAAAEGATALLCAAAARAVPLAGVTTAAWRAASLLVALLALNTLFALDLLAIELARGLARAGGWYEARRGLQAAVLGTLVVLAVAALAARPARRLAPWAHAEAHQQHGVAAALPKTLLTTGLALLAAVAVLRAVSLHATDLWLATRLAGVSLGRLADAAGLLLVAAAALATLRHARH